MNLQKTTCTVLFFLSILQGLSQGGNTDSTRFYNFFARTSYHPFTNSIGPVNIQMYELFLGYRLNSKDIVGLKSATWKIFEPMGIQLWDPNLLKESEWFDGRIREFGFGLFYQRMLWKGLYGSVEVMPMKKTFLDMDNNKIATGFRLYTSYHVGYHISFLKNRLFIEPQIHCNYWPVNSPGPEGFKEQVEKYNNFFLFEPNLYIGINF